MTAELLDLVLVTTFLGCLWIPYVLNRVMVGPGVRHEVGYPEPPTVLSPWAARLKRAHLNTLENLAVFAPLVLVAHALNVHGPLTVWSAHAFLASRIAYVAVYTAAVPWLRTILFTVGWCCQLAFAAAVLRP